MKKEFVFGIVGLIAGVVIGFLAANAINRQNVNAVIIPETKADPTTAQPSSTGGMLKDVADTIQKAENEPENFAAQMRTGDMYAQIGRFDKAIEFYKRGVLLKPDDFNSNVVLANALFDSQQFEAAADYYSKAIKINGNDVDARTDLAATFVERANPDYDRAIKELGAALEVKANHEPTLYYLGIAYHRKGDAENAKKTLTYLEKVNSSSPLVARLRQNMSEK